MTLQSVVTRYEGTGAVRTKQLLGLITCVDSDCCPAPAYRACLSVDQSHRWCLVLPSARTTTCESYPGPDSCTCLDECVCMALRMKLRRALHGSEDTLYADVYCH